MPSNRAHGSLAGRLVGRPWRALALLVSAVLAVTVLGTLPASADPGDGGSSSSSTASPKPSTSDQAKKAWLDASDKAEIANEDLLTAQQHEKDARHAAARAKVAVAKANLQVATTQSAAVQAAATYASYRSQLAEFASATFRGARLGQLSALLTARSSSDYLDEVSSLDQVAGHTRVVMAKALKAKKSAQAAADAAKRAQADADAAKAKADAAVTSAEQATKTVTHRKQVLDTQVATYHKLFNSLTAKERQAAMEAQQAAWERQSLQQQQQQAELLAQRQQQADQRAAAAQGQQAPVQQQQQAPVRPLADNRVAGNGDVAASKGDPSGSKAPASSSTKAPAARTKGQIAVDAALTKLGYPYVYGTAGPNTFDCSGLTSWAWAQAGVTIPRTSSGQSTLPYVPLDQLQPGDLVTYYSPVHHVALYIGNGQIIDASTESKPIFITSVYRGGPNPTGHRVNY